MEATQRKLEETILAVSIQCPSLHLDLLCAPKEWQLCAQNSTHCSEWRLPTWVGQLGSF